MTTKTKLIILAVVIVLGLGYMSCNSKSCSVSNIFTTEKNN